MADMKPQVYKDPRPAEYFDAVPRRRARKGVGWIYDLRPRRSSRCRRSCSTGRGRSGSRTCPSTGAADPRPQPLQPDGPLLRRRLPARARSASWPNRSSSARPVLTYIYKHGGVFPVRRGHHDEEAFKTAYAILDQGEMLLIYAEGGRSRTRRAGRAEAGDRPDRARVRRPGRPGRDPRLRRRARLEAPPLPEGHGPVRRAAHLPGRGRARAASASTRRPTEIFDRVREMYVELEENGRRDVIKRLREGLPAASPSPDPTEIGSR